MEALKATREVRVVKGSALESEISVVSSNIDCLQEEFIRQGDQIRSSLTEEEGLCQRLISAFPR